ncbi:MAG: hypothetical protein ACXW2E_01470 [Nitrososphaeraceae archaeon]
MKDYRRVLVNVHVPEDCIDDHLNSGSVTVSSISWNRMDNRMDVDFCVNKGFDIEVDLGCISELDEMIEEYEGLKTDYDEVIEENSMLQERITDLEAILAENSGGVFDKIRNLFQRKEA